jgi:hypothetical protein
MEGFPYHRFLREGNDMKYDPAEAPDPEKWNALNEAERLSDIESSHKKNIPQLRLHAAIHLVVENQAALGDETPVRQTLDRLQEEGLDRHDAIHAIGSILAEHLHGIMTGTANDDANENYFSRIKQLTAEAWRNS